MDQTSDPESVVSSAYQRSGIPFHSINVRRFPGELIVVVEVDESNFERAVAVANELDDQIPGGFVTVKRIRDKPFQGGGAIASLNDSRVTALIELLSSRSRTSEQQPSLKYVKDAAENLSVATTARHHLIFGRRGVGKTALMLEAKRLVADRGDLAIWLNLQTMRALSAHQAFLFLANRLVDLPQQSRNETGKLRLSGKLAEDLRKKLGAPTPKGLESHISLIVPEMNYFLKVLTSENQGEVFLFFDDIHYLQMKEVPIFLDLVHSISRDIPVWIKAAGIRHQMRWFRDNPPTGLQAGHDATIINLDITLENPEKAKAFLTNLLGTYVHESGVGRISALVTRDALDRLVLASGGVPRDFLLLTGMAIQVTRERAKARFTGVQDVNEAAGRNSATKIQELEDDAASSFGHAQVRVDALRALDDFLITEQKTTYFRIDLHEKEHRSAEYGLIQSLMDLRLVHLIHSSISDEHHAGRRSEVYMFDLSRFSGARFKRNLPVLDFSGDHLVLKNTGQKPRPGDTPHKLLSILRRAPLFSLETLTNLAKAEPELAV